MIRVIISTRHTVTRPSWTIVVPDWRQFQIRNFVQVNTGILNYPCQFSLSYYLFYLYIHYVEWMTAVRESADDQYTLMYYDFQCVSMISFCALHNWTFISDKTCLDSDGKTKHSIYERRTHATSEYL